MAEEIKQTIIRILDNCRHFLGEIQKDKVYLYCKRCKRMVLVHQHHEPITSNLSGTVYTAKQ